MALQLPSFLRRRVLLHEARRALLTGAPQRALALLADPALADFDGALELRRQVLSLLCEDAERRAAAGDRSGAERLLALLAAQDPERALELRARIGGEAASSFASRSGSRAGAGGLRGALEELLGRMREEREQRAGARAPAADPAHPETPGDPPLRARPSAELFLLAVDDSGEYLCALGDELWLGHSSSARADLRLLADIEARHACLCFVESFHGGTGWELVPAPGCKVAVGERELGPAGVRLAHGDRVRLAPQLSFVFESPEPGCASAVLRLQHGAECEGAARILLLRPGAAGALRLGPRTDRLVRVPTLREEILLSQEGAELSLECASGLACAPPTAGAATPTRVRLACPPRERVDLRLLAAPNDRPPFGLCLRPLPERGGVGR